jgi:hypothetical protein
MASDLNLIDLAHVPGQGVHVQGAQKISRITQYTPLIPLIAQRPRLLLGEISCLGLHTVEIGKFVVAGFALFRGGSEVISPFFLWLEGLAEDRDLVAFDPKAHRELPMATRSVQP